MKKQRFLFIGVMVVSLISFNFSKNVNSKAEETTTLQEAENQKMVQTKILSKGKYSGDCMNLSLTNLKKTAQKINVPAGTVFIADEGSEQNILVTRDIMCYLKPGESKTVDISGYCCEKSDAAPDEGSTFKTSMHKDDKVIKLVNYLKTKNFDDNTIQDAVWCVANGSCVSSIYSDDPAQQKELMKFVCALTGQKETWYTSRQNHEMDESRRIISSPIEIKGMLTCTIDKPMHVSNEVFDSENNLVYSMGDPMLFPRKGNYSYEFNMKVEGWEKGKYYVLVKGGDKELLKQEFEL